MENMKGGSLEEYIKRNGPLDEQQASKVIKQMCLALTYIHDKNIVHRDIKPDNILLSNEN